MELFQYSVTATSPKYEEREPVLLNEVLEESLAGFYLSFQKRGIEPKIQMTEKSVWRRANRDALLRIFGNIISNAVKYSDGDLEVELSDAGEIRFENRASVLGEVEAGKLFERFYTVESGRGSAGLGLSIARTMTEQMGGQISAEKEGTVFRILLSFPEEE